MIQLYPPKDSGFRFGCLTLGKPPVKKPAELEVAYFYAYFTMEPLSHVTPDKSFRTTSGENILQKACTYRCEWMFHMEHEPWP